MPRMRSEDRRRQLLEVSAELFAQGGYRGTTTAELAKAASVTEPILYRHFDNKLDLFVTLVDEVGKEVLAAWQEALNGTQDPHDRLMAILSSNPASNEKGLIAYRVIFQAMTEIGRDPEIAKPLRRHLSKLHTFIRDEIINLQKAGAVRTDEPASLLAWMLMNVAIGFGMTIPLGISGQTGAVSKKAMQNMLYELMSAS